MILYCTAICIVLKKEKSFLEFAVRGITSVAALVV